MQRSDLLARLKKRQVDRVSELSGIVPLTPGVLWDGPFYGYSGYAKANREVMFRVSNHMYIQARHSIRIPMDDKWVMNRIAPLEKMMVPEYAPYLRFFGPDHKEDGDRQKIVYTMMETESRVHKDMARLINRNFHELWVPTEWNRWTFKNSGIRVRTRLMPLGVDRCVYRPMEKAEMPMCRLLSTSKKGLRASPRGFNFVSVGLPSFRKGFDVMAQAFENAFAGKKNVNLIIATTHSTSQVPTLMGLGRKKARIWALEGSYDEHQLAEIYNASDCYVTASRGEGWNLPMCEAAACGKPVIAPRATSHPEVLGKEYSLLFDAEGSEPMPGGEHISPWYAGMEFTKLGKKSTQQLTDMMRMVHGRQQSRKQAVEELEQRFPLWSWDDTAALVTRRLMELQ